MASRMHKIEDIDGASNTNISSEDTSMLFTQNGESTTRLSVKSYCYTWTINDFFRCLEFYLVQRNSDLRFNFYSAPFMFVNTEWYWRLSVITECAWSKRKVKDMEIVLKSKSNIANDLHIKNEFSIVDDDGGKVFSISPRILIAAKGDMKEYSCSFIPLFGTETFFPKKLIVRSEFSALISEICEDTESSLSKYGSRDVCESDCLTKNDATSVFPQPKNCSRRSVLSRIPPFSWLERVGVEMREFLIPILVVLCVSLVWVLLNNENYDD